ncbi:calcium-dependent protein kinase 6, putative, partial [Plasmodium malariae]
NIINYNGKNNNKNYDVNVSIYEKDRYINNLRIMEKKQSEELVTMYNANQNNLKKNDLRKNIQSRVKSSNIENKSKSNIISAKYTNVRIDKNKYNTFNNMDDKTIMFNIIGSTASTPTSATTTITTAATSGNVKLKYKDEMINNVEYMNNSLYKSTSYKDSNYIITKMEAGYKELKYTGKYAREPIQDSNVEDKKKNKIKNFLEKIKHRKNNEENLIKKEHRNYEQEQKKDKLKMKFIDILHTGTLGNFFHRSKSNYAKSLSPQRKRDNSFNSVSSSNDVYKISLDYSKKSKIMNTLHHYESNNTPFQFSIKDEAKYYNRQELKREIYYNSNEESKVKNNLVYDSLS